MRFDQLKYAEMLFLAESSYINIDFVYEASGQLRINIR